jgi:hypothetical protein
MTIGGPLTFLNWVRLGVAVCCVTWISISCSPGASPSATLPRTDGTIETNYISLYEAHGTALDRATGQVAANCGSSIAPSTLCVVAAEDALHTDLAFITAISDVELPTRFAMAHTLLIRALSHAALGFDLRIEALRDRSTSELNEAFSELSLAGQLLRTSFAAFPPDVRSKATPAGTY